MNTKTILCLLAAACLTACSSDDDEQIAPAERPLSVVVGENPMPEEDAEGQNAPATRGTLITTDNLTSFSMNYGSNKYTIAKSGNGWTTTPSEWPNGVTNDQAITFYAYNAGTYNEDEKGSYIHFDMENTASSSKDLLVAKSDEVTYTNTNGTVPLTFDHVCVALDFKVKITNTLQTSLGAGNSLTIKSIKLQGIYDKGDYYFGSKTWSNLGNSDGFSGLTLTNSDISVTTEAQPLSCGTLFIIPQAVTNDTKLVITFIDSKSSESEKTISLSNVIWTSSRKKTVTIKIGTTLYGTTNS